MLKYYYIYNGVEEEIDSSEYEDYIVSDSEYRMETKAEGKLHVGEHRQNARERGYDSWNLEWYGGSVVIKNIKASKEK